MNSTFQKYYLNYADVHSYELKINVITHQNKLFYLTWIGCSPQMLAYHHIDFTWPV